MSTPIRGSGSTTPPQYSPAEEANSTASPSGSSSRPRQSEGSGPLAGLERRSTAGRQPPRSVEEAHAQLDELEEQAHSGQITEESYRLQANALARAVRTLPQTAETANFQQRLTATTMQYAEVAIRNLGQPLQQVAARYNVTNPQNLAHLQAVATQTANTGGPRLTATTMQYAEVAIRNLGQPLQQVAARYNVTNPQDLAHLQAVATQTANTGGPRLTATKMQYAEVAIRNLGQPLQQVAARYNVTNPQDLAHLQAVATQTETAGFNEL